MFSEVLIVIKKKKSGSVVKEVWEKLDQTELNSFFAVGLLGSFNILILFENPLSGGIYSIS